MKQTGQKSDGELCEIFKILIVSSFHKECLQTASGSVGLRPPGPRTTEVQCRSFVPGPKWGLPSPKLPGL